MEDSEVIELWRKELDFDSWWKEFLGGQDLNNQSNFDFSIPSDLIPWTESVAGDVVEAKIQSYLTYQAGSGSWHAWDGRIHSPCSADIIVQKVIKELYSAITKALTYIQDVVEARVVKAASEGVEEKDLKALSGLYDVKFKKHKDFRDRLASMAGISAMVGICKTVFDRADDYFDNDQRYLVVRNCVFDLDSIRNANERIFPVPVVHDASMPITRYLDVDYDPALYGSDGKSSLWYQFLDSSMEDNKDKDEVLKHLQKVVGASFMGEPKLRTIINLKGPPSSGKSVFANTLWKIGTAGSEYCVMPDSRALTKVQGTNFEQDRFKGKRFIAISEPSSREDIDDDFLKKFTGDEWIETRTLHTKSSGWAPQGAIFVSSNQTLRISSRDEAIVQRVQVIEFPYHFVSNPTEDNEKEIDPTLAERLASEKSKSEILNWIIEGMQMFYFGIDSTNPRNIPEKAENGIYSDARKLELPESIKARQEKLLATGTAALRWLNDQVESGTLVIADQRPPGSPPVQANAYLNVVEAYRMFTLWVAQNGESPVPTRFFIDDLSSKFPLVKYGYDKLLKGLLKSNRPFNTMSTINIQKAETPQETGSTEPEGVEIPSDFSLPPSNMFKETQ